MKNMCVIKKKKLVKTMVHICFLKYSHFSFNRTIQASQSYIMSQ